MLPPPCAISRTAKTSHGARRGQDTVELQLTGPHGGKVGPPSSNSLLVERRGKQLCAKTPSWLCLPWAPRSPALEFPCGQCPATPRGLALPRAPWVTRCLAKPSLAQTERNSLTTHTSTQVWGPAVRSAGSTVSRDTFLECTGRGPRGPARNSRQIPRNRLQHSQEGRPDSTRRNTWRDTHPA